MPISTAYKRLLCVSLSSFLPFRLSQEWGVHLILQCLLYGNFQLSVECSPDCLGFALLRSTIGSENQRDALNQSDAKRKPIVIWSPAFSRTFGFFFCFYLESSLANDNVNIWLTIVITLGFVFQYCTFIVNINLSLLILRKHCWLIHRVANQTFTLC